MNKADFPLHKAADKNLLAVSNRSRQHKDLVAFRVPPPTPLNGLAGNRFSERHNRALRRLQNDAVITDEGNCLRRCHDYVFGIISPGICCLS